MRTLHWIRVGFGLLISILVYGGIALAAFGVINPGSPYLMFE